jgi:hypothetical protein
MIRALTLARTTGALLVVLATASCNSTDSPSAPVETPPAVSEPDSSAPTDTAAVADTVAVVDSLTQESAVLYTGIPYGPHALWATVTTLKWGPGPFTLSQDNTFANSIVARINAARQQHQRLVLSMTGGLASEYKTDGKFDLAKWKTRMNTFKTTTIKNAVAAGVADGTIVGNKLIDEPETPKWGGVMTKPLIDQMATYVKNIFPTLPVGVNMGAPGYTWRTWERFKVVDYVLMQYQWSNNQGNIGSWRDKVLAWSQAEGVTPFFSLNLLDGGVPDYVGTWDCAGTGGKGTLAHRCRMTADQVRTWGRAVGPYGCAMLMWQYDDAFMAKSANQYAFRDVGSLLASKPRRSCRRP